MKKLVAAKAVHFNGKSLTTRRASVQNLPGRCEFLGHKLEHEESRHEFTIRESREEHGAGSTTGEPFTPTTRTIEPITLSVKLQLTKLTFKIDDLLEWRKPQELGRCELAPAVVRITGESTCKYG